VWFSITAKPYSAITKDTSRYHGQRLNMLQSAFNALGDLNVSVCVTGSGGLSVGKWLDMPFVQEVIAASSAVKAFIPKTDVALSLAAKTPNHLFFGQHRAAHERHLRRRHRRVYRPDGGAARNRRVRP
jgi:hypothetical protein